METLLELRRVARIGVGAAALGLALPAAPAPVALGSYDVDIRQSSVSGISSGGYMANQFHVAYSSIIRGAGILAAGPYYCAAGNLAIALTNCTTPTAANPPDVEFSRRTTDEAAARGEIDATSNLAGSRVWLFSGTLDATVYPVVVDKLAAYYRHYVDPANIAYEKGVPAAHAMITEDFGYPCDHAGNGDNPADHFINDCRYDAAGLLLGHIYGRLKPPASQLSGVFIEFPQDEFIAEPASHSMNPYGYAYVPASCEDGAACKVHVAFHGCRQQPARIGDIFYRNAGYNEWADTNDIIVLYPQAIHSELPPVYNPRGCWDWWGYDDPDYHKQNGRQMRAVRHMLQRLSAGYQPKAPTAPQGLAVTQTGEHSVGLRWEASAGTPRVVGYNVYVATGTAGPYSPANGDAPVAGTQYSVEGLASGTQYHFVVRAVNKRGMESANSDRVSATTAGLPQLLPLSLD